MPIAHSYTTITSCVKFEFDLGWNAESIQLIVPQVAASRVLLLLLFLVTVWHFYRDLILALLVPLPSPDQRLTEILYKFY